MTLGMFAMAVAAPPRWVLNALTRLRIPRRYDEPLARRLALAKRLSETTGAALSEAFALATLALDEADPQTVWRQESDDGAIVLSIDMPRFFTAYGARLAMALDQYGEKTRGRKPSRRGSAVARAQAYGVDTTLLESQLARTMERRVRDAAENVEFLKAMRKATSEF
jgi:hypothetical protein